MCCCCRRLSKSLTCCVFYSRNALCVVLCSLALFSLLLCHKSLLDSILKHTLWLCRPSWSLSTMLTAAFDLMAYDKRRDRMYDNHKNHIKDFFLLATFSPLMALWQLFSIYFLELMRWDKIETIKMYPRMVGVWA